MYKIYSDFDETITMRDVGTQILSRFGTSAAFDIWKDFDAGKKTPAQCLRIACETASNMTEEAIEKIIKEQTLRSGFMEFVRFCNAQGIDLSIVSDGFSIYISRILDQAGLSHRSEERR